MYVITAKSYPFLDYLIKLYVAKKAIKDLSVYKLWLSMKQMKRMFITLLKFYRTNQCWVYIYLKSRKNVRKKILGKDFPPEAKNAPNKRTGTRNKGSLVK